MQVAPAELEAILLGHPQVLDAAVIPYVVFQCLSLSLFDLSVFINTYFAVLKMKKLDRYQWHMW
jgi:hypothetical protein